MANLNSNHKAFISMMKKSPDHAQGGFKLLVKKNNFIDFFDELKQAGLFDKSHNLGPVPGNKEGYFSIPFWEALPYLQAIAKWSGENNSIEVANKVLDIVKEVSLETIDGKAKDNYHTWRIFAEILSLVPNEAITDSYIALVPIWLSSTYDRSLVGIAIGSKLLPKLLASSSQLDWDKASKIFNHCIAIKWNSNAYDNGPVSVIDDHWLKDFLSKNTAALGKRCGDAAAAALLGKLEEIYKAREQVPSYWTRPAIEEHAQNHSHRGVENRIVEGLRDVLISWAEEDQHAAKNFIDNLIDHKLTIVRRTAIYLVNIHFNKLRQLTDKIIPLIKDNDHLHELYGLLESHFVDFEETQKQQTINAIKELPISAKDEGGIFQKRKQRNWLSAIKGKGYKAADEFFEELNSNTEIGGISPHPSFLSYMQSGWGPGPSAYEAPELISLLDQGKLIETLNKFKNSDEWKGPTIEALVNALEEAVEQEPLKFIIVLNDFTKAKRPYQYGVINGFKGLWDKSKNTYIAVEWERNWRALLTFFEKLIFDKVFWDETAEKEKGRLQPNKDWIPSLISDFLRAGTHDDNRRIPSELMPRVWTLICEMLNRSSTDWRIEDKDAMHQAINNEKGKIIEAMVEYALCLARLEEKNTQKHMTAWKQVEAVFDSELAKCKNDNYEFSTLMGSYLGNMEYLSYDWVQHNINLIFPIDYMNNFLCALHGLAYSSHASKRSYILMRDSGIIQKALEVEVESKQAREILLQRVALAYIWGDEALDSERIKYIFNSQQSLSDLQEIAQFYWSIHDTKIKQDRIQRVIDFWRQVMNWTSAQKVIPTALLSTLGLLLRYLETITEEQEAWLIMIAPYVSQNYNDDRFITELERLADKNPKAVKNIFLELMKTYSPYFDMDDKIRSIILKLSQNGFKSDILITFEKLRHIEGFTELYKELAMKVS